MKSEADHLDLSADTQEPAAGGEVAAPSRARRRGDRPYRKVRRAPYAIRCLVCDQKLMGVSYPVIYRPETLETLNLVHSSEEGAWCSYCRQVTVFVRDPET